MDRRITLVTTSCGRPELLRRTLESLAQCDVCFHDTIIVEDSKEAPPSWIHSNPQLTNLGPIRWLANGKKCGTLYSLDTAYEMVTTPYIFSCNAEWLFGRSPFLLPSIDILERHPDILQVLVREDASVSRAPGTTRVFDVSFDDADGRSGGFSFAPGLLRLSDYHRIGSYSALRWLSQ